MYTNSGIEYFKKPLYNSKHEGKHLYLQFIFYLFNFYYLFFNLVCNFHIAQKLKSLPNRILNTQKYNRLKILEDGFAYQYIPLYHTLHTLVKHISPTPLHCK